MLDVRWWKWTTHIYSGTVLKRNSEVLGLHWVFELIYTASFERYLLLFELNHIVFTGSYSAHTDFIDITKHIIILYMSYIYDALFQTTQHYAILVHNEFFYFWFLYIHLNACGSYLQCSHFISVKDLNSSSTAGPAPSRHTSNKVLKESPDVQWNSDRNFRSDVKPSPTSELPQKTEK